MGYFPFAFWDPTILILIPGVILTMVAQSMVNRAYKEYSQIQTRNGITGAQAARAIMQNNGLAGIGIDLIPGQLTDNYSPTDRIMHLSGPVAQGNTIASVGIAAHETGHALQHAEGYWPLKFRNFIVPVCNFASTAAWPLFFIGLLFSARGGTFGIYLMDAGIILFLVALIFYVITLPVEFNASKRAVQALREQNLLDEDEIYGVQRVLKAAALTYVASMTAALLNLVRLLALRGRSR